MFYFENMCLRCVLDYKLIIIPGEAQFSECQGCHGFNYGYAVFDFIARYSQNNIFKR